MKRVTTMAKVIGSLFKEDGFPYAICNYATNFCPQVDNKIYAQKAWLGLQQL